jgi:hypothetical protein
MIISTKNLTPLPDIATLQKLCKSLATLDAIICREWESRYYSYNNAWDKNKMEEYFEMRDGCGDQFQILFSSDGVVINGYAHESEMNNWIEREVAPTTFMGKVKAIFGEQITVSEPKIWKGVIDRLPEVFKNFMYGEPIKSIGTTFCIWRQHTENSWKIGNIKFPEDEYGDGSADLLYILDNDPKTYKNWAIEYYDQFECDDKKLNLKSVKHIYDFKPLTKDIVLELNPDIEDWDSLKKDLEEISYLFNF